MADPLSSSLVGHNGHGDVAYDGNVGWQRVTYGSGLLAAQVATSFGYDRAGRLSTSHQSVPSPLTTSYAWDDADNRTGAGAATFAYDERNRLLSGPGGAYGYAPRGTLASVTAPGGGATTYEFDGLGRMRGTNGAATYAYDSLDRIAARAGAAFSYAGAELDPVSDGSSRYGRSPSGSLLSVADPLSSSLVGHNRHGDVAYTFSPLGVVGGGRVFGPFGDVVATTGAVAGSLGFQGGFTDAATGDVAMNTRWYRPGTGSFLSRDSVLGSTSTPATLNRYLYANANPLRFYDPDGRAAIETSGVSSMAEYKADSARQARLEAEAKAYGIPTRLNDRDRPWVGDQSLGRVLALARQNHKCNCDVTKLPYLYDDSLWSYLGKSTHQFLVGAANGFLGTVSLGWIPEIPPAYSEDHPRLARSATIGKVVGVAVALIGTGVATKIPRIARVVTAYRSLGLGTRMALGGLSGSGLAALSKGATLNRVLLGGLLGAAAPGLGAVVRSGRRAPPITSWDDRARRSNDRSLRRGTRRRIHSG